jgi:peptidyl-dipeptidase Dcp
MNSCTPERPCLPPDKERLKKMNSEESTLSDTFSKKLLAANTAGRTPRPRPMRSRASARRSSPPRLRGAGASQSRDTSCRCRTRRSSRCSARSRARDADAIFDNSWNRTEHGDANDTRSIVSRLAQLRAQRASLLGFPNHAAWQLKDQMAKTPENALDFMNTLVPLATARAAREGKDIQAADRRSARRLHARGLGLGFLRRAGSQGEVRQLDEAR